MKKRRKQLRTKITDKERLEILLLYLIGFPVEVIGKTYGVSRWTPPGIATRWGFTLRDHGAGGRNTLGRNGQESDMPNIDVIFTRHLLSQIRPEVKAAGYKTMKDGWVWCAGRSHWEFHGPDKFYWHGSAGTAYEARYKGWSAFLEKKGLRP